MSDPAFMSAVEWRPTNAKAGGDLPYATHAGEMELFGLKFRCFRLNTGQAIIHADDMDALLQMMADPGSELAGKTKEGQEP